FRSIATMLHQGVIEPITSVFPSAEEVTGAAQRLQGVQNVLDMLPGFLSELNGRMESLANAPFWNEDLADNAQTFAAYFYGIASTLGLGIINPIRRWFPDTEEITELTGRLQGMGAAISEAHQMLNKISTELGPLVSGFWIFSDISKISGQADKFGAYFQGIAATLRAGIINPIRDHFPPAAELNETVSQLTAMVTIINKVTEALTALSTASQQLGKTNVDFAVMYKMNLEELATAMTTLNAATATAPKAAAGEITAPTGAVTSPTGNITSPTGTTSERDRRR